ncbi:MAG: hypothetical protein HY296_06105 [Thaumarchaeota archaeon]|nr:hypothetical protein [Nitrososphaerota archaeon]
MEHLVDLRASLTKFGFKGRLGILSSVIRSEGAMRTLSTLRPFALFLTLECITRRDLLLKESKASLSPEEAIRVLSRARREGIDTGVMIVVGLDDIVDVTRWLKEAVLHLTDFPNLQIFQSHSPYMDFFRTKGADNLEFFLRARTEFEAILSLTPLRPHNWQNYRPLWYTSFGSEKLQCP